MIKRVMISMLLVSLVAVAPAAVFPQAAWSWTENTSPDWNRATWHSGQALDSLGAPLSDVLVRIEGSYRVKFAETDASYPLLVETDANGYYTALVPRSWTGTVALVEEGLILPSPGPAVWSWSENTSPNWNRATWYSGQALDSLGAPISDVLVKLEGSYQAKFAETTVAFDCLVETDANGYYTALVPRSWTGTVALVEEGLILP